MSSGLTQRPGRACQQTPINVTTTCISTLNTPHDLRSSGMKHASLGEPHNSCHCGALSIPRKAFGPNSVLMRAECQCLQRRRCAGGGAAGASGGGAVSAPVKPARQWTSISSEVSEPGESSIPHSHRGRQCRALSLLRRIYSGPICLCRPHVNVYT